jgi:hypothetical protein
MKSVRERGTRRMWEVLGIGFGIVFSVFYGYGVGLIARVWWLANEPSESQNPPPPQRQSDAA